MKLNLFRKITDIKLDTPKPPFNRSNSTMKTPDQCAKSIDTIKTSLDSVLVSLLLTSNTFGKLV